MATSLKQQGGREICPHCSCSLSRKVYEAHKRLYFNADSNQWVKKLCLTSIEYRDSLAITELALEECDDFQNSDVDERRIGSTSDPPPLVDFDSDNSVISEVDEPW